MSAFEEDRNVAEKLPLMRPWKEDGATGVLPNSWTVFFSALKHTLLHAIMFTITSVGFMLGYHLIPRSLTVIALFFAFACLSEALYLFYVRRRLTKEALGFAVCALAIIAGAVVGTSLHLTKLVDYFPYEQRRHYTNVAPDEKAASHSDASVLVFMEGARPDPSRAMGYLRGGHRYCVAPIALEAGYSDEELSSNVQYWAVGKDCCMGNKGFVCDDATNTKARAGLVKSEKMGVDGMFEGIMSSNEMAYYEKAVLMTMAKFDLESPEERLYVRFVEDIQKARWEYWWDAWWSWTQYQFLWLVVWIVAGVMAVVIGAGDPEDPNSYNAHISDAKMGMLWKMNHYI
jgi:hypothetical protein